jgi:integrase
MDEFNKLLATNDKKRKQSSLDQASNNIRRLYMKCYGTEPEDISQISGMVEDIGHTFGCLQSQGWSYSTMLAYTNALLIANDLLGLDLSATYGDLETELQVGREDDKRKNPQKDTKISREQLDKILADLKEQAKTRAGVRAYALFQIIGKYPFRLESATLEWISDTDFNQLSVEDKGIHNYLVEGSNHMKFSFNGYKTDKKYGTREIQVDQELYETLLELSDLQGQEDYVFFPGKEGTLEKSQGKQRNNLSVWVKRLLKKSGIDASATDVTKLLITEIWDTGTTQDKVRFAAWRGHEVQTAAKVYATQL